MLNVSQAYKDMMTGRKVSCRLALSIVSEMHVEALTDKNILADNFSITWRASNNRDFSLGTCYASALAFTTVNAGFGHGGLVGSEITVTASVFYDIGNNQEEEIPLGIFYADKVTENTKTVNFSCYDGMIFFDKPLPSFFNGYAYGVLSYICGECGVELGSSAAEINSMPNYDKMLEFDPEEIVTFRDALSYVASTLGAYCIIGRDGKLYVRQFHSTPDITLGAYRSTSVAHSGRCRFNGVKARFLAEQNYYPYEYEDEDRVGMVVDLGDIPIISGTDQTKNEILENIYEDVLLNYDYRMCSISIVGNPAIEPGDCISYQMSGNTTENSILTAVTYKLHGESILVAEGQDVNAGRSSSQRKKSSQKEQKTAQELAIITVSYVNASEITVDGSEETTVSLLRYVTNKDVTVIFGAEIPVYSDGEGIVTLTYANTGIEGDVVRARVHEGYNLITLVNHMHHQANEIVNLTLEAQTSGINGGSAPTLTIDENTIRSYVFAQGISGEAAWDGIIVCEDDVERIEIDTISEVVAESACLVSLINVIKEELADNISAVDLGTISHATLTESVSITLEYVDVSFCDTEIYCGEARLL